MRSTSEFHYLFWVFSLILTTFGSSVLSLNCEHQNTTTKCIGDNCKEPLQERCGDDDSSKNWACFVAWQRKFNEDTSYTDVVQFKGCFLNNKQCVGEESCVARDHGKTDDTKKVVTLFCCCSEDNCNKEYFWSPVPTTPSPIKNNLISPPEKQNSTPILVFVMVPLGCTLIILTMYFLHRRVLKKPIPQSQAGINDEENILLDKSDCNNTLGSISLLEVKASGRFGNVWKASMAGNPNYVAVKILPLRERTSWLLEQEIFSLPLMCDSDFVLKFIGAKKGTDGESLNQYWLISEYLEQGSLYDYLKGNVLKWPDLLQIAVTMCQGLAFLHEELDYGVKKYKPAVAHRDFKSKNVLLKPDLTACVADFGLAHIFYPTKPVGTCHGQVGTRRYMSPEVLEGAVSFTRDNFQRIDMYACGLVLWELASRCNAQPGPTVAEYKLPFDEYFEVKQPTLEEMQELVVNQRKRPTIRNDWLTHPGMGVLSEAMKDSWDQDAEARISASCIVERLNAFTNKLNIL